MHERTAGERHAGGGRGVARASQVRLEMNARAMPIFDVEQLRRRGRIAATERDDRLAHEADVGGIARDAIRVIFVLEIVEPDATRQLVAEPDDRERDVGAAVAVESASRAIC